MTELGFRRFHVVSGETVQVIVTAIATPYLAIWSRLSTMTWTIVQPPSGQREVRTFNVLASPASRDSFELLLDFVRSSDELVPTGAKYKVQIEGDRGSFAHHETIDPVAPFPIDANYRFRID
jgi:hypothetical protein